MAQPTTGRQLVDLLCQSQLLDPPLLRQLEQQVTVHLSGDPKRLAKTLIKNSLVTEYQARQLLAGRYKGFYIGKYKLLEVIGAGGMGKVFLAEQTAMERLVAVKVLSQARRPERQKESLARFKREAKAVAALNHPHIVHAYDFAEENGIPYIVMEFVEGIDTARLVAQFGPAPVAAAAEYIRQAAAGLHQAHRAGLVHRDVKPGNLLVDTEGTVKLLDLGLVAALGDQRDDSLTVDQDQLGTVDYIAPEQAVDSHNVDIRADVYSLGATLYAILAGQSLFPGKSTAQKLVLHQTEMPRPLRELRPEVPEGLAHVVTQMLAKRREDRPSSMEVVQELLQPFAQLSRPPYDASAVKLRRATFEPFLGKSPDAAQISVATLGKPDSELRTPGTSQSKQPTAQLSMIGIDGGSSNELDPFSMSGDFTELALALPRPVRKWKGGKKSRSTGLAPERWMTLAGIAGGIAVMILLSVVLFTREAESTVIPAPAEAPVALNSKAARQQQQLPGVTFDDWLKYTETLRADPKLVAHYRMLDPWGADLSIRSDAGSASPMPLAVVKAKWGDGRWPRKGAVVFSGPGSGQYAAFSTADARKLDFQKTTTLAIWFKVSQFTEPWQVLIGKGEQSWKLQRTEERGTLSAILHTVESPAGPNQPQPKLASVRVDGRIKVDDGRWHLAVIAFTVAGKNRPPVVKLVVDGRVDGRSEAQKPFNSDDPIWIAASSDSQAREANATRNFHGLIDEVIVWHRALDDAELTALYNAGRP